MRVLVTGGSGFIGSAFVRAAVGSWGWAVLNFDKLTYAAPPGALDHVDGHPNYAFIRGDIADAAAVAGALSGFAPDAIVHFAAETHVDRSIDSSADFIRTNILGVHVLLEAARRSARPGFRFLHVSTDEVFGALGPTGKFTPETPYDPRSPYSASKAASDHLVRAWGHTYGLPAIICNCSNNYGPFQFPEKLIPVMILAGLEGRPMPVYGDGLQVRDWLHVEDHVAALRAALERGQPGATYLIGGGAEMTNLDMVRRICAALDARRPDPGGPRERLIAHVADRPGHDRRYAIEFQATTDALGWRPATALADGLARTVDWYLDNRSWWEAIRAKSYRGERLGLGGEP
jgi:dTDP-glucose 4,6-dehydratase